MRYPTSNADFFNTGDFNNNNNNNKNTFSFEDTTKSNNNNNNTINFGVGGGNNNVAAASSAVNGLHQRKVSSSTTATMASALPTHVRNRSGGTGGSGSTPTTINFNNTTTGSSGSTTPPTSSSTGFIPPPANNRQNSLGFDNTTSFLGNNSGTPDFEGRTLSGGIGGDLFGNNNNNNNNNNISMMGRQNSSSLGDTQNSSSGMIYDDDNEPPLLEELGIRPDHIRDKVKLVLNPFSQVTSSHELCMDEDLAGPLTFVVCLGFLLTLQGKVHFGAIYGTSVVGILLSYFLLNMMSRDVPVRSTLVVSTLGYCLLPDLLLAIFVTLHLAFVGGGSVGVFLPVLCLVTVSWSAWCAMKIFAEAFQLHHVRYLILYPSFLFYAVFAAITMF